MNTDAIVVFDETMTKDLRIRARRAGQATSKMRFASAQLERFITDGLWLRLAGQANSAARRIADLLGKIPQVEITAPVEANEVFLRLPEKAIDFLQKGGVQLYRRGQGHVRLVCRFDTAPSDVEGLYRMMREAVTA
jgi:threonine aldolase